jgi:hypothetical protein
MKGKKLFLLVVGLAVFSLVLAACGSSSSGGGNFPTGKFVLPDNNLSGLYFGSDGTWYAFDFGEHLAEGTYSVKGDTYTELTNNAGCSAPMSFHYTFDGTNLTFQYVGDPSKDTCEGRRNGFNGVTYILVK